MDEGLWMEAAASLQSELDAQVREEAYEVFVAEASRCRLTDRTGPIRVALRCGRVMTGVVVVDADRPAGTIAVRVETGALLLLPHEAILHVSGTRPGLRDEGRSPPSLASLLRETWSLGTSTRLLLADGRWMGGVLEFVGGDHVDLGTADGSVSIPFLAVEAWSLEDAR
jgi:hypothetical protein